MAQISALLALAVLVVAAVFVLAVDTKEEKKDAISRPSQITLSSPAVTQFGDWYPWEDCPEGTYVIGMKLKTHSSQGKLKDDTALNGITLLCGEIGSKDVNVTISSGSHKFGEFGKDFYCEGIASGFQLRSEKYQILQDNSAANNLRLYCNNHQNNMIEGDGLTFGDWTMPQECFSKQGICGLQTQVETKKTRDDTALNNVNMKCCDIPDPAKVCTPEDKWDLLIDCDNTEALTPTTCTYERKIGLSDTRSSSESHFDVTNIYHDLGFSLKGAASVLNANFEYKLDVSRTTGHNWTRTTSETWNEETTTTISFDVPPKVRTTLLQTVGKCGMYNVRTTRVKRIDTQPENLMSITSIIYI